VALEDLIKFMRNQDKQKVQPTPRQTPLGALLNNRKQQKPPTPKKPRQMMSSPPRNPELELNRLRRVSSSELVDDSEKYDLNLNALNSMEQRNVREPLFNEFKFREEFKIKSLTSIIENTKQSVHWDLNDPDVHQLNLTLKEDVRASRKSSHR
jgi:hypothetical protein